MPLRSKPADQRAVATPLPSPVASPGTMQVAAMTAHLAADKLVRFPRRETGRTALDRVLASLDPIRPAGLRDTIDLTHPLSREFEQAAQLIGADSAYGFVQAPTPEELPALVNFRFRALDNFAHGPWSQLQFPKGNKLTLVPQEAKLVFACRVCRHPSTAMIQAAFEVVAANAPPRRGGSRGGMQYAWNRDLPALRRLLADRPLAATERFAAIFPELVADQGVLEAVCFVLEQAFEFERTCDRISGFQRELRTLPRGDAMAKGKHFGDCSPNALHLASVSPELIEHRDWRTLQGVNCRAIAGIPMAQHGISPPEGDRWHTLLGHSPLDFILHYLFRTQARFASYLRAPAPSELVYDVDSCFLRLALNILAHIDAEEAQAHLAARVRHSKRSGVLDRQIERKDFDMFPTAGNELLAPILVASHFGSSFVGRARKRDRKRVDNGLLDENLNPFARAFFYPEGWSTPRSTTTLKRAWRHFEQPLSLIDGRYVGKGDGGKDAGIIEIRRALESASLLIEGQNPMSLCRGFGLRAQYLSSALACAKT